jgi:hypothetical protein
MRYLAAIHTTFPKPPDRGGNGAAAGGRRLPHGRQGIAARLFDAFRAQE